MDGVHALARARVCADGTAELRLSLGRRIIYHVTGAIAAALEGVIEADPMTRFVRQRLWQNPVSTMPAIAGPGDWKDAGAAANGARRTLPSLYGTSVPLGRDE